VAAIVTGASGAIGSATVRAFAARGTNVVLAALESESEALEVLAQEARAKGVRALVVSTDVTKRADIDALVAATLAEFGTIDALANIAGIGSTPSLCDESDENIERIFAINLLGCARTMQAVLPTMIANRRGAIVNIGSVAGEAAVMGVYSASKFGLRGLNDSVRREVRMYGIGVTLIEPGFVRSPMNAAMGDGLPSPDIVANAVVRAVDRPRRKIIVPMWYRFPLFAVHAFPWLIDLVFGDARIQDRLNRDAREARAQQARA
jgi:NAD(P)-dependent dehydrogenase (short-subunit alcohol dehydrogenase family)